MLCVRQQRNRPSERSYSIKPGQQRSCFGENSFISSPSTVENRSHHVSRKSRGLSLAPTRRNASALCLPDPDVELEDQLRRLTMVSQPSVGKSDPADGSSGNPWEECQKKEKPKYVMDNGIVKRAAYFRDPSHRSCSHSGHSQALPGHSSEPGRGHSETGTPQDAGAGRQSSHVLHQRLPTVHSR